jgi:GTP cyclohydrolase I
MANMKHWSTELVETEARRIARTIYQQCKRGDKVRIYGVPRGGIPAAYAVAAGFNQESTSYTAQVVSDPAIATVFMDDIIDSGRTMGRYIEKYGKPFYALVDKLKNPDEFWHEFPWERRESGENADTFNDNVVRMLQAIGEDPDREGLLETPGRVVKAWKEWFGGYGQDPGKLFKAFADGAERTVNDEMVIVSNIPVYSHCEHHLAAIFGHAHVAYIPNGKIIGLSKVARVVKCFAQRLQVQERLTNQIADSFMEHLAPKGVGVILKCRHFCMESRGVNIPGTVTTTSALRGQVLLNHDTRQEFLTLSAAAEPKC